MKTFSTFLLLIILTLLYSGCETGDCLGKYLLSSEDIHTVPFNGNESLVFVKGNDTVRLECWKHARERDKDYPSDYSRDYYIREISYTRFSGEEVDLDINVYSHYYPTNYSTLEISFRDENDDFIGCVRPWRLPLMKETFYDTQWIEDSMTVQGFTYYNVYCDSVTCLYSNDLFILYYSKAYGLLKYEYADGTAWELLEID